MVYFPTFFHETSTIHVGKFIIKIYRSSHGMVFKSISFEAPAGQEMRRSVKAFRKRNPTPHHELFSL